MSTTEEPKPVDDKKRPTVDADGAEASPAPKVKRNRREERGNRNTEWKPQLDENGNPIPKSERRPKRKVAVMIGYCGTGYNGLQIQNDPNVKTIEAELFKGFVGAGAVSPENADDIKKNAFMRAARTDKGVHAAGNVISAKLIIEDEDIVEKINAELPDQIRVWGIQRVTKSFDCRKMCSSRIYEYLLPTYSLLPPKPHTVLADLLLEQDKKHLGIRRDDTEGAQWWRETRAEIVASGITEAQLDELLEQMKAGESPKTYDSEGHITEAGRFIKSIKQIENRRRREYKVSPERLALFRETMKQYEGSNNFHNYTIGKPYRDPSARRYIMETTVSDPFVIEGTEWVSVKLHGQSFMLHQIRKMIAMACLIVRTGCPIDRIRASYGPTKINIPKAPALGLLLECPVYNVYNQQLEKANHANIDFSKYSAEMDAFKMKNIYDKIYAEEASDNVFYGFFGFIDSFKSSTDNIHKDLRDAGETDIGHVFDFLGGDYDSGITEDKPDKQDKKDSSEKPASEEPVAPAKDNVE
ncbi:tRNA pseudouridine synthase 1 [Diutina catenulata]